jgi:hypothetical protein
MGWPNDPAARGSAVEFLRQWADGSKVVPPGLGRIQHEWLRVADILSLHYDLVQGEHQKRRGGASIGKAITLAAANTKSWGTAASSFWKNWSTYKDVAHLVTAATLICSESRSAFTRKPFGPSGLAWNQLIPFQMAMLMPDLVIAVALNFEDLLGSASYPTLSPSRHSIPKRYGAYRLISTSCRLRRRFARSERRMLWSSISDVPAIDASPRSARLLQFLAERPQVTPISGYFGQSPGTSPMRACPIDYRLLRRRYSQPPEDDRSHEIFGGEAAVLVGLGSEHAPIPGHLVRPGWPIHCWGLRTGASQATREGARGTKGTTPWAWVLRACA